MPNALEIATATLLRGIEQCNDKIRSLATASDTDEDLYGLNAQRCRHERELRAMTNFDYLTGLGALFEESGEDAESKLLSRIYVLSMNETMTISLNTAEPYRERIASEVKDKLSVELEKAHDGMGWVGTWSPPWCECPLYIRLDTV